MFQVFSIVQEHCLFFFKEKNYFVLIMGSNNEIMNFHEKKKIGQKNAKVTTNFTIES